MVFYPGRNPILFLHATTSGLQEVFEVGYKGGERFLLFLMDEAVSLFYNLVFCFPGIPDDDVCRWVVERATSSYLFFVHSCIHCVKYGLYQHNILHA